jgi:hypothetical protein
MVSMTSGCMVVSRSVWWLHSLAYSQVLSPGEPTVGCTEVAGNNNLAVSRLLLGLSVSFEGHGKKLVTRSVEGEG